MTLIAPRLLAGSDVVGFSLSTNAGSFESYTVPAGKTLLIEHMTAFYANNSPATPRIMIEINLLVQNGGIGNMPFGFRVADKYEAVSLKPPLRVESGRDVRVHNNSSLCYNNIRVQGLLVDNNDLYAQNLDLELTPVGIEDGRFVAEATLNSPRPALIKTETSVDLEAFEANATEEKTRQADPTKWLVSTAADSDKKFLTATASARESN